MDLERHCSKCGYPLNLAINTVCDDCGENNIVYEEVFYRGGNGVNVIIHVNRQSEAHGGIWSTFWLLENSGTGRRSPAQVMLTTAGKTLPEAVENARRALTENPEGWGLIYR